MSKINEELMHQQTIIISELLIKTTALENVLLSKGLINNNEVSAETKKVVAKLTEAMKNNLNIPETTTNSEK